MYYLPILLTIKNNKYLYLIWFLHLFGCIFKLFSDSVVFFNTIVVGVRFYCDLQTYILNITYELQLLTKMRFVWKFYRFSIASRCVNTCTMLKSKHSHVHININITLDFDSFSSTFIRIHLNTFLIIHSFHAHLFNNCLLNVLRNVIARSLVVNIASSYLVVPFAAF